MGDAYQYQVLARKYRPTNFNALIGQEAMVRTLKNAFEHNRIAHAFVMTGVRGVGKTTTARIIAKGMNCTGLDGKGGPTITPCEECESCKKISEGHHIDVLEMDAASRTRVSEMREILDSVAYRAASARYKVYIIDEVHMLSTSAFNALLKTLEEPPHHVKFIFATTEIHKIPVTVLSRCQRFDLKRIEPDVMLAFLQEIAEKENVSSSHDALQLITRASEGSVRDALSLLDQAIAYGKDAIHADSVRSMLGLTNRAAIIDLFELIMQGDAQSALGHLQEQYSDGADPLAILRELADVTHWVSIVKINPASADDPTIPPDEKARGVKFANALHMRSLSRMWQMLLSALEEVKRAPNQMMAVEMTIIRLTYVADLPSPDELIKKLQGDAKPSALPSPSSEASAPTPHHPKAVNTASSLAYATSHPQPQAVEQPASNTAQLLEKFPDFKSVVNFIREKGDFLLCTNIEHHVGLVNYRPGLIEFEAKHNAPKKLAAHLSESLSQSTGERWIATVVQSGGAPTLKEERDAREAETMERAYAHPLVKDIMDVFPGTTIKTIHKPSDAPKRENDPLAREQDENTLDNASWSPFEDE